MKNLRLTCRSLTLRTRAECAARVFSQLDVVLNRRSLEKFVYLTGTDVFASAFRNVRVFGAAADRDSINHIYPYTADEGCSARSILLRSCKGKN